MAQYNYISGSTISNSVNTMFNLFESGECYLGFAKGYPQGQWGINALVNIEQAHGTSFPTNVIAVSGSLPTENIFFDINSVKITNSGDDKRLIKIVKYLKTDINFSSPILVIGADGNLKLCNLNPDWAVIEGLDKNFLAQQQNLVDYNLYEYYILPAADVTPSWLNNAIQLKINKKNLTSTPFYSTKVKLSMTIDNVTDIVYTGLEKETNFVGETFIKGVINPYTYNNNIIINDPFTYFNNSTSGNNILFSGSFKLLDEETNDVIIDSMTMVQPSGFLNTIYTETDSVYGIKKFFTMKYTATDGRDKFINFLVGERNSDSLAIWNEQLPFESVTSISDSNPPALDITYLKNPMFNSSIFDVNGLTKINYTNDINTELKFVKQVFTVEDQEYYTNATSGKGFTLENIILTGDLEIHTGTVSKDTASNVKIIELYDDHNFVIGDVITVPNSPVTYVVEAVGYENNKGYIELDNPLTFTPGHILNQYDVITSSETDVNTNISFITTTNKELALRYGCTNVMITKKVPLLGVLSPTENTYRQLFISHKPKNTSGTVCTDAVYNGDLNTYGANFNINKWTNDNGSIFYLANKITIYRKWANKDEEFKIIL